MIALLFLSLLACEVLDADLGCHYPPDEGQLLYEEPNPALLTASSRQLAELALPALEAELGEPLEDPELAGALGALLLEHAGSAWFWRRQAEVEPLWSAEEEALARAGQSPVIAALAYVNSQFYPRRVVPTDCGTGLYTLAAEHVSLQDCWVRGKAGERWSSGDGPLPREEDGSCAIRECVDDPREDPAAGRDAMLALLDAHREAEGRMLPGLAALSRANVAAVLAVHALRRSQQVEDFPAYRALAEALPPRPEIEP